MNKTMIRQGDVLVVPVTEIPPGAVAAQPESGRLILARGEATGHHHSIALSERVTMFRDDGAGGGLFLTVSPGAPVALEHQEHTALPVVPGRHRVLIQRTYQSGMVRRVAD